MLTIVQWSPALTVIGCNIYSGCKVELAVGIAILGYRDPGPFFNPEIPGL